jgi:hypothetical protein
LHESLLAGAHCIKFSQPGRRAKNRWSASLSIVAQGCKEIVLGREVYRCEGAQYIATPLDLPVTSWIFSATPKKPFLSLKIDFDPITLSEIASQLDNEFSNESESPLRAMFIGKVSDQMLEAALRLGKLFQTLQRSDSHESYSISETSSVIRGKTPDDRRGRVGRRISI